MIDDRDEGADPAERRAQELLALVGTQAPDVRADLPGVVVRRARGQRAIAQPLRLLGEFVAAIVTTAQGLLRPDRTRGDR